MAGSNYQVGYFADSPDSINEGGGEKETNWSGWSNSFVVTSAVVPDATIVVDNCPIPLGSNECSNVVAWNSQYTISPRRLTHNRTEISTDTTGTETLDLPRGIHTFSFFHDDGAERLDQKTITAECVSGARGWDAVASTCVALPPRSLVIGPDDIIIKADKQIIRGGTDVVITWEVLSTDEYFCTVTGPKINPAGVGQEDPTFLLPPVIPGVYQGSQTVSGLKNNSSYTITCADTFFVYLVYPN